MKYRPLAVAVTGLALLAASAAVPIGGARAAEVVEEVVDTAEAVQARVMLPVRFDIDPVAKTLEAVALPGLEQGLDASGEVVSAVKVPFELTTAPVASPADDPPPDCSPSTTSAPNFTPYPPRYATRQEKDKLFLQYMFQTNQRDFARTLLGKDTRQFMECVAGGGRTFTNHEQTVNGAGSTMEDTATSLLINEEGMKWGKDEDPKGVNANLAFKVEKGPISVTASIDGLGGSGYDGSQGSDKNAYYLNDYARNQVNGYWKSGFGGATEAYKGNVSLALWEYSMSDTVNRLTTIRNQAWMVYQCGSPWRFMSKCTALGLAPPFDGPEITPKEQAANFAGSARWDVLVPQDAQDPTTLAFDYGDGTPETRVSIPVGGGASTFTFSHTFSATGTYTQRATIVEVGTFMEATTTHVATNAPIITPPAQVMNSAGTASWIVRVLKEAARQTTLRFDFGDGTHEDRPIPQGSGEVSFSFSHTFSGASESPATDNGGDSLTSSQTSSTPMGTATYTQSATVVETGANAVAVSLSVSRPLNDGGGGGGGGGGGLLEGDELPLPCLIVDYAGGGPDGLLVDLCSRADGEDGGAKPRGGAHVLGICPLDPVYGYPL